MDETTKPQKGCHCTQCVDVGKVHLDQDALARADMVVAADYPKKVEPRLPIDRADIGCRCNLCVDEGG